MATLEMNFQTAAKSILTLTNRPDDATLLTLYALYKQATEGDLQGSRPGIFDLKRRKKYDAWRSLSGTARETAMTKYIELANQLLADGR